MSQIKIVLCWSGGKDSALALHRLQQSGRYEVVALITTCNELYQRVSMHGVRTELLDLQAASLGLPVEKVFVGPAGSNEEYVERMNSALAGWRARGVTGCAFGDIFLADLRAWREAQLAKVGLEAVFPLWSENTSQLLTEFWAQGFRTTVCCVNDAWLDASFVGRELDADFVRSLPDGVDPCGENGEFHTFAHAGPIFRDPIPLAVGEKVYRPLPPSAATDCPLPGQRQTRGFWFCDLQAAAMPVAGAY